MAGEEEGVEIVDSERKVRSAAIGLLARREHSLVELRQKLGKRFPEWFSLFDDVFLALQKEGLQSDARFAEAYLRMRHGRGYGPTKIGLELLQRGIANDVVLSCMSEAGFDWYLSAAEVLSKKYPGGVLCFSDRSKAQRFLHYRGFEHEHISETLRGCG